MEAEQFEVQRLQRGADSWRNVTPAFCCTRSRADADLAHLRGTMPGDAFRIVPAEFGERARLGDVAAGGEIETAVGRCATGRFQVTAEQADNAAIFGWSRARTLANGRVWIERQAETV